MDWVTPISAVLVAISALFTAYFARRGLTVWQQQLKGTDDYKLARDLLASLYKCRDAIYDIRQPSMFLEVPHKLQNIETKENDIEEKQEFNAVLQGYERKWEILFEQRKQTYDDLVVATALWGDEIYTLYNELFKQAHMVNDSARWLFRIINPNIPDEHVLERNDLQAILQKYRDKCAIAFSEGDQDPFWREVMQTVEPIERYLREKLEAALK